MQHYSTLTVTRRNPLQFLRNCCVSVCIALVCTNRLYDCDFLIVCKQRNLHIIKKRQYFYVVYHHYPGCITVAVCLCSCYIAADATGDLVLKSLLIRLAQIRGNFLLTATSWENWTGWVVQHCVPYWYQSTTTHKYKRSREVQGGGGIMLLFNHLSLYLSFLLAWYPKDMIKGWLCVGII